MGYQSLRAPMQGA